MSVADHAWSWAAFVLGASVSLTLVTLLVLIERLAPLAPRWTRWPMAVALTIVLATVAIWFVVSKSVPIAVGGMTGCFAGAIAYRLHFGHWWDEG